LIYLFIGGVSMLANMGFFMLGNFLSVPVDYSIAGAFVLAAAVNYVLCVLILFRHKARWRTAGELFLYGVTTVFMGLIDFGLTRALIALSGWLILSKFAASVMGFVGNFLLRKWLVFPERKKGARSRK